MAKARNKLMKLRTALKKMNSFGKLLNDTNNSNPECSVEQSQHVTLLHTVYVGKSMRPYQVSHQVLDHPVIQELLSKSDDYGQDTVVVKCEVVLFEHLLWMLQQHSDSLSDQPLDDLVAFYAY